MTTVYDVEHVTSTQDFASTKITPLVTEQVGWRAATLMREYRRPHSGIGLGDYLIAATVLISRR